MIQKYLCWTLLVFNCTLQLLYMFLIFLQNSCKIKQQEAPAKTTNEQTQDVGPKEPNDSVDNNPEEASGETEAQHSVEEAGEGPAIEVTDTSDNAGR